jgi:hypothetical protein
MSFGDSLRQIFRRTFSSAKSALKVYTSVDDEFEIQYAIERIFADYGDVVSVASKNKALLKYGRNQNVGSGSGGYTIWYTGQDEANETYAAANTNPIDSVSSSSTSDVDKEITIEGHTESGNEKVFVVQTVTLQGRTRVPLTTPLNRCTRGFNQGSVDFVGEIYAYQNTGLSAGKPSDTTKIHLTVPAGTNQSRKASTSISNIDYWIITGFRGSLLEKANSYADVELQVRLNGKVFREVDDVSCSNAGTGIYNFKPYLIVPKNSDVRLIAVSDSASRDVSGSIQGYLAKVVS